MAAASSSVVNKITETAGETAQNITPAIGNFLAIVLPIFFAIATVIFAIQWVLEAMKKNGDPNASRNANEVIKHKMIFTLICLAGLILSSAIVGILFATN